MDQMKNKNTSIYIHFLLANSYWSFNFQTGSSTLSSISFSKAWYKNRDHSSKMFLIKLEKYKKLNRASLFGAWSAFYNLWEVWVAEKVSSPPLFLFPSPSNNPDCILKRVPFWNVKIFFCCLSFAFLSRTAFPFCWVGPSEWRIWEREPGTATQLDTSHSSGDHSQL